MSEPKRVESQFASGAWESMAAIAKVGEGGRKGKGVEGEGARHERERGGALEWGAGAEMTRLAQSFYVCWRALFPREVLTSAVAAEGKGISRD